MARGTDMEKALITFEPDPLPVRASRRAAAKGYIEKALCVGAPLAVEFQNKLVERGLDDDGTLSDADRKLAFQASEAILDRFLGKAAQEIRVGDTEGRPIVFDQRLAVLKEGMAAALDAVVRDPGADMRTVFDDTVAARMVDEADPQGGTV